MLLIRLNGDQHFAKGGIKKAEVQEDEHDERPERNRIRVGARFLVV